MMHFASYEMFGELKDGVPERCCHVRLTRCVLRPVRCVRMRLRPRLRPGHRWGSLQCSPRPSSWIWEKGSGNGKATDGKGTEGDGKGEWKWKLGEIWECGGEMERTRDGKGVEGEGKEGKGREEGERNEI